MTKRQKFQAECAASARRAAEKCRAAGNEANARHFERLAECHEKHAAMSANDLRRRSAR